ncbi:MAG: hypothetical protein DWQ37_10505 [Planctomycetota bacterium]|nr:MAG: hypothetical protein DWQ37_10505 [Planctomycetota bacterium]
MSCACLQCGLIANDERSQQRSGVDAEVPAWFMVLVNIAGLVLKAAIPALLLLAAWLLFRHSFR